MQEKSTESGNQEVSRFYPSIFLYNSLQSYTPFSKLYINTHTPPTCPLLHSNQINKLPSQYLQQHFEKGSKKEEEEEEEEEEESRDL